MDSKTRLLRFQITYLTSPGQDILVSGNVPALGKWSVDGALRLTYSNEGQWYGTAEVEADAKLEYKYAIRSSSETVWEAGKDRVLDLTTCPPGNLLLQDSWKVESSPEQGYLYTSIFKDIFAHPVSPVKLTSKPDTILVRLLVDAALVKPDQSVHILGELPELGEWQLSRSIPLLYNKDGFFFVDLSIPARVSSFPFEFKFLVKNSDNNIDRWEEGSNRKIEFPKKPVVSTIVYSSVFRQSNYSWKGAGVAIPVFSIRTTKGLGVGEFSDLKVLADFCVKIGCKIMQILPIYDTSCYNTWRDSYPYSALSVFALHPLYLHIPAITTDEGILSRVREASKELNKLREIDYEAVIKAKLQFIDEAYAADKNATISSEGFCQFFAENAEWLVPYAIFKHLSEKFYTTDYLTWPEEYKHINKETLDHVASSQRALLNRYYYTQYHLHCQLKEASDYAGSKGIGIKGDLPIGVNLRSVDSWIQPDQFNLNMSTGAPPDQFAENGQNWGFPTYNWERMKADNYAWWKMRLRQMGKYFKAFRIDHILGFFRIWEIPRDFDSGLMGHFYPSVPIHKNELDARGIWDIQRLTLPYIHWNDIDKEFGHNAQYIADLYLDKTPAGTYVLKPHLSTEAQIQEHFGKLQPHDIPHGRPGLEHMKNAFSAWSKNVVLLRQKEHPEWHFYPRINMDKTASFQYLPDSWKIGLKELYNDYYFRRQDHMWGKIGLERLPVIKVASDMLVCGEDLGMIPDCVPPVLKRLSILGLCVQRMPSDPKKLFGHPSDYDYMTVCTTSSHDCSTVRAWWEEDPAKTQKFYNEILGEHGAAPAFCEPWISRKIIEQHLFSKSMWAIFPIQDFFALQASLRVENPKSEQINEPSNPIHYWRYRIHITLEELCEHTDLIGDLKDLVVRSGRF